jgi:5'(3')-deoxyribonucleotidase
MILLIDLDSTVADLLTPWLAAYNKEYDDNLTVDKITTFNMHEFVKPECNNRIYHYLTPDLFSSLEPLPGVLDAIEKLESNDHEIIFVTAAPFGTVDAKISWVRRWFPSVNKKNVITAHKKYLIKGDVLIDDSPENLINYKNHWPESITATIAYPYNREAIAHTDIYAEDWQDTAKAWDTICRKLTMVE